MKHLLHVILAFLLTALSMFTGIFSASAMEIEPAAAAPVLQADTSANGKVWFLYNNQTCTISESQPLSMPVEAGTSLEFHIQPDSGYHLESITENGGALAFSLIDKELFSYTMPSADASLQFKFAKSSIDTENQPDLTSYDLSLTAGKGGSITLSSPGTEDYVLQNGSLESSFSEGTNFTLLVQAEEGYEIKEIKSNQKVLPLDDSLKQIYSISFTMDQNQSFSALFEKIETENDKDDTESGTDSDSSQDKISIYQAAYNLAKQIYPGNVDSLLWDDALYKLAMSRGWTSEKSSYIGTTGADLYTISLVNNNNVPIKNLVVTRILINGSQSYCVNPMGVFKTGNKVKIDAFDVLQPQTVKMGCLVRYYVENSQKINGKTYGIFSQTGEWQYMIIQCLIYRVISVYEPGMSFGNSHLVANSAFNWSDQERLINDAMDFAENNMDNYTNYSASIYVTNSVSDPSQPAVIFRIPSEISKGSLTLKKISSNTDLTNGNNQYSLAGAQYGVYTSSNATNLVGTLTVNADGSSNVLKDLEAKTYYIKEIKAPAGYALDSTIYSVVVNKNETTTFTAKDNPQYGTISQIIFKNDDQGNPLAGALFTVKFYAGNYDKDPALQNITPARTWVLQSDQSGKVLLDQDHKVSGDPFYTDPVKKAILPLGTVTIQETKAPEGYLADSTLYIQKITENTSGSQSAVIFNPLQISNKPVSLKVVKTQKSAGTPIPNVEFLHTDPSGTSTTLITDENGSFTLKALKKGVHTLQEVSVPDGYILDGTPVTFEVLEDGSIQLAASNTSTQVVLESGILKITNNPMDFSIQIHKKDDLGRPVANAKFGLYEDASCSQLLEEKSSDASGMIQFENLNPEKTYYVQETQAPDGYVLPVDSNGKTPVYTIKALLNPAADRYEFSVNGQIVSVQTDDPLFGISVESGRAVLNMEIENETYKAVLPSTGGAGTMNYWKIGFFMMLAACIFMLFAQMSGAK